MKSAFQKGREFFFTVKLPIASVDDPGDTHIDELINNEIDFLKIHILVVDDVEINRIIITELLIDTGAEID